MTDERIIAVGLLTKADIERWGPTFERLWPVDETPCFSQLLQAIDQADRGLSASGWISLGGKLSADSTFDPNGHWEQRGQQPSL